MKCRAVFAITVVFLAGCAGHVPPKRTTLNAPAAATVSANAGPTDLYPDAQLTPGVTNPDVTQANISETVCRSGWTATARPPASYTNNLKKEGITQYGYDDSKLADYEEDHFIPLEIGGNPKDPNNLWPEPYDTKVNGKTIGAHQKDKVEDLLKKQVCEGTITLKEAQDQISGDWYKIYLAHY
jgi:hypothetical protein